MRFIAALPLVLVLTLPATVSPALALTDPAPIATTSAAEGHIGQTQAIRYDSEGRYVEPQAIGAEDKIWLGEDGQYRCKRKDGTTGLVIGAVVGGLFGSAITGKSTLGTILGTVGGGLLGRSIERGEAKCQ